MQSAILLCMVRVRVMQSAILLHLVNFSTNNLKYYADIVTFCLTEHIK